MRHIVDTPFKMSRPPEAGQERLPPDEAEPNAKPRAAFRAEPRQLMAKSDGFVSLKSLKARDKTDPEVTLAEIRRIYYKTTKQTIEHDLAHAIELLKSLESEDERDKARVFMDGISQMRSEWARQQKKKAWASGPAAILVAIGISAAVSPG
jgi:hypothetical protein